MRIIAASAPLRRSPQADAPLETEALFGETVTVYDERGRWAWAQLERDQYVGYLPAVALGAQSAPTHRVAALRTHAYPGPAIKNVTLSMAPKESQDAIKEYGRPEYEGWLAQFPHTQSLEPKAQVEAFRIWDQQVGTQKTK